MSISLNKSSPNNFELYIPLLPGCSSLDSSRSIMLNIHNVVIPGIANNSTEHAFMGSNIFFGGTVNFSEWTISFIIDENFENWQYLYNWLMLIFDKKENFNANCDDYSIDMTLNIVNNFKKTVLKLKFVGAFIFSLGDVTLSYRDNASIVESEASFYYRYYEIIN